MNKKVKILRIIARLNIGGPAIHTILLTEGLNKDRFDSLLVAGVICEGEEDMMYLAESKKVKPIIISELGRKVNFRNDLIAFWKLFELIKKEKPDIIHTHTAKAGALGRLAGILYNFVYRLPLYRCKLIHTFHGHVLHSYFGKLKTWTFVWIERILTRFTDRIIVVSESVKRELLNLGIGREDKIAVIPLGLELERLLTLEDKIEYMKDGLAIGIIGRLVPVKNHRMFIEAAKLLSEVRSPRSEVKFIITGDGELREDLERYVKELGLEDKVIFIGWRRDLEEVYNDLDIVALTSLNEGTPVSLIEAMAAGKPVVATEVGGVRDLLNTESEALSPKSNNFNKLKITKRGILVSSQDAEGFAQGLSLLLNDRQLREKMGKAGREFVKDRFSKDRLIKDIETLYEGLLRRE